MRLLHVSLKNLDGMIKRPSIPDNDFTQLGLEDNQTPRVSFGTDIQKCLLATGLDLVEKVVYVHEPVSYSDLEIVDNETLISKRLVVDAHTSGEVWVLNPVKLKLIRKILVHSDWRYDTIV